MTSPKEKELRFFDSAFELAYWIHANKEIAFFIAEDAMDKLPSVLGKQNKYRKPAEQLRGFLKWGERTRPVRKTVKLNEYQMLQWLVFRESEPWECQTERGEGPYSPTEEDLIVRYIEYLTLITFKRDSFYVTMAVCSLLYQFDRRETRLFHDILTQSDWARMKDTNYIGKQRLEILEKLSNRFGRFIQTTKTPGQEKRFVKRPTTQWVIDLVKECLQRFTPWETGCVVQPEFDVTDISGLYLSESAVSETEEDLIELNRTHTILHPKCLRLFCEGLSKYVQTLPRGDLDRRCDFNSLDERLSVPLFFNLPNASTRGDRFKSPRLNPEDYIRLQRMLEARGHRRKSFVPRELRVYVDGSLKRCFEPKNEKRVNLLIGAETGVVEVTGADARGELTLAIVPRVSDLITGFKDEVIQPGGRKITVALTPQGEKGQVVDGAQLEVKYAEPASTRLVSWLIRLASTRSMLHRDGPFLEAMSDGSLFIRAGAVLALIIVVFSVLWWRIPRSRLNPPVEPTHLTSQPQQQTQLVSKVPQAFNTPSPPTSQRRVSDKDAQLIARAAWSMSREDALVAIPIEATRSQSQNIELSTKKVGLFLIMPAYDNDGHLYSRYRLTLTEGKNRLWQQTLGAPKANSDLHSHVLSFSILGRQVTKRGPFELTVTARNHRRWQPVGDLTFSPKAR